MQCDDRFAWAPAPNKEHHDQRAAHRPRSSDPATRSEATIWTRDFLLATLRAYPPTIGAARVQRRRYHHSRQP